MNPIFDTYRPPGFGTVSGYLMVDEPIVLVEFLKNAFYATEGLRTVSEDTGGIMNTIMTIGTSCFMIGQARGELRTTSSFYLYVNDVDLVHQNAMKHGGHVVYEPMDMPYLDRQSGIKDPCGNFWWISKRLVETEYTHNNNNTDS